MARILVEMNWPEPLDDGQLSDERSALMRCIGERGGNWLHTYVNPERTRTICLFEAPDAQSMREAYRHAGVQGAQVWAADLVEATNARPG